MFREWHYQKDGREWGPLTSEELHALVGEGHIQPTTLVRRSDWENWLPFLNVVDVEGSSSPVPVLPAEGPIPVEYARPSPQPLVSPLNVKYAGFWIRVAATLIDLLLIGLVAHGVEIIFGLLNLAARGFDDVGAGAFLVLMWLYFTWSECSSRQGTLGKQSFGLRVTDLYGQRLSFGRATGRFFAKYLSMLPFYIGFFAVGLTQKKQGFHDHLAGTIVVRD